MDAAKNTVKKFMSNDGKHDTTVHQKTEAAVQNETIARHEHTQQTTAVDREVHQDHYHTTEQPIHHSEVLPEQHHHQAAPVEHRSFEHDDHDKNRGILDAGRQQYYDTQDRVEGDKTHSHQPTVQGEHVHHHVHETIQPVVQKQTVEPHVVHSTVPIHEVHHNEAHHHASTALPPVSMDEFKNQGGALGGHDWKQTRHEPGEPQSIGGHTVRNEHGPIAGTTDHSGMDERTKHATTERIGSDARTNPSSGLESDRMGTDRMGGDRMDTGRVGDDGRTGHTSGLDNRGPTTGTSGGTSGIPGTSGYQGGSGDRIGTDGRLPGSSDTSGYNTSSMGDTTAKKPSLMDKLNPKKDADGDGKAGFMK